MADFYLTLEGIWDSGKFESLKKVVRQQKQLDPDITITGTVLNKLDKQIDWQTDRIG